MNQNLTDMGSLPILNPKGTMRKKGSMEDFSFGESKDTPLF